MESDKNKTPEKAPCIPQSPRRGLNATDTTVSSRSFSLDAALLANLSLEDKLEAEASKETLEACLKRMLSIKSVVSTTSSFAERQQVAFGTTPMFKEIGTGSIGKIFEHPGTLFVYKLPLSAYPDKLWNNYKMHQRVKMSFDALPYVDGQVEIPKCFCYKGPTSTYEKITHSRTDFTRRITSLWMIDFDDCGDISMDEQGLEKAVKAFIETNHYCPRPNTGNDFIQRAWVTFGENYLYWSGKVLEKTGSSTLNDLPRKFLIKIFEKTKKPEQEASPS